MNDDNNIGEPGGVRPEEIRARRDAKAGRAVKNKKILLIALGSIVGLIVLFAVIGGIFGSDAMDDEPAAMPPATEEPEATEASDEPEEQATEEEKPSETESGAEVEPELSLDQDEALGAPIRDVSQDAEIDSTTEMVTISFPIQESLTKGTMRSGAQIDTLEFLKAVDGSDVSYSEVLILGSFSMVDEYGNVKDRDILTANYSHETVDRINFDDILIENVWEVADHSYVHPELQG